MIKRFLKSKLCSKTMKASMIGLLMVVVGSVAALSADTPKRLLVCSVTQGFRHASIEEGEAALKEIAQAHGGFEIVVWVQQPSIDVPRRPRAPRRPSEGASEGAMRQYQQRHDDYQRAMAEWTPEREAEARRLQSELEAAQREALLALSPDALREKNIDGVAFLNTTGNLSLPDLDGLLDWVEAGNAFITVHAGTDTLKDEPRYAEMTQGIFESHGPQVEATLHAGDLGHPANAGLGETWHLPREEIYLFRGHDRSKVRVLWFMRHHPNHPEKAGYFPIAWCREVGSGRFFNTAIGHRHDLWSVDPDLSGRINPVEVAEQFRAHLLGGILWALGLEEGASAPNPGVD
jgi:type 1 glutamine amidotransferase